MRTSLFVLITLVAFCGLLCAKNNPVPFVNQPLVPDCAKPGGRGFILAVNGTGFVRGAQVNWNGKSRSTTFVSQSRLKAKILASDVAHAQTTAVTVLNPRPGGGRSNVGNFEVVKPHHLAFSSGSRFNQGNGNSTMFNFAFGDFNGDDKLDLIGPTALGGNIMVQLGEGNGQFGNPIFTQVQPTTYGMAVMGDFNEDGVLDFAIINDTNSVALFLGKGNGEFRAQRTFLTGIDPYPYWLVAADFNGDGHLDLATASSYDNTIRVLLGNGDGTLKAHIDSPTGTSPSFLTVGDFNRDGKLDLAVTTVANNSYVLTIMLGNGDGTFRKGKTYPSFPAYQFLLADMNHDGKLDIVASSGVALYIIPGKGDGEFGKPREVWNVGHEYYYVYGLGVADMEGTDTLDIVTVEITGNGDPPEFLTVVNVSKGTGFQYQVYTTGDPAVDLNNDGRPDAIGALGESDVYFNQAYFQTSGAHSHEVGEHSGSK